jgi:hypothetical protein
LALESLFEERRFLYFDFTEGENEHKRLFGTNHSTCANIAFMTPTLRNQALTLAHYYFGLAVARLGLWLDKHELRSRVRRWIRFSSAQSFSRQ